MPYPIEDKLVIVVASEVFFDLSEFDQVFQEQGAIAYRDHRKNIWTPPWRRAGITVRT
jgi:hypothetical protein